VDRERCDNGIPFRQAPGEGQRQIKVPAVSGEAILCEVEALRTVKYRNDRVRGVFGVVRRQRHVTLRLFPRGSGVTA
jgi:hypothetical protein